MYLLLIPREYDRYSKKDKKYKPRLQKPMQKVNLAPKNLTRLR